LEEADIGNLAEPHRAASVSAFGTRVRAVAFER